MKRVLQNMMLCALAIVAGVAVVEIVLILDGRYNSLVSQKLVHSPAIWERPVSATEYMRHPDLGVAIEIRTDADGVRNHFAPSTSEKRHIIAFFGDSFVENRRMEERFTFTSILDVAASPNARVVNYGVEGYGLDQAYLRYRKYQAHDIRHVVYVFCENDLRNLYETGLTEIADGRITFRPPNTRLLYRILGRLHLTYLLMSAYGQAGSIDWGGLVADRRPRVHDQYADAVVTDLLSEQPSERTAQLAQKFLLLLETWKREVESAGRTFTVLVLPRPIDSEVASTLLHAYSGHVVHTNPYFGDYAGFSFRSDGHWNEYGNLKAAQFVADEAQFPFHSQFKRKDFLGGLRPQIDNYYQQPQASMPQTP